MSMLAHTMNTLTDWASALPMDFNISDSDSKPGLPTGVNSIQNQFLRIVSLSKWAALAICVLALIFGALGMLRGARRGDGGEHAATIGWVLGAVIVVSGAVSIIGFIANA
jgi:hypothetical protein